MKPERTETYRMLKQALTREYRDRKLATTPEDDAFISDNIRAINRTITLIWESPELTKQLRDAAKQFADSGRSLTR